MIKKKLNSAVFVSIVILVIFLIIGLRIFRDYGASSDELNQIEAGHVIWKFLCQKFHLPIPSSISDAPELDGYFNRFYGQAATFFTVVIEAIYKFNLDSSTILKIRHLWNFLNYFVGLCCFGLLLHQTFEKWCAPIGLLFMIILPRIFGDIFYNDRDTMLIAWLMISLAGMQWYMSKPRWYSGLFCGFACAMAINTRLFGLILLIFIMFFLFDESKRKNAVILILISIGFWILFSPVYWRNPIEMIPESIIYLSRKQRSLDTNDAWPVLYLGKYYNETQLPWFYVPLYVLITTPFVTIMMSLFGVLLFICRIFRGVVWHRTDDLTGFRRLFSSGMVIIMLSFVVIVIPFHPSLYNGWRHFYFLYLPIVWMAIEGMDFLFNLQRKSPVRVISFVLIAVSFCVNVSWMVSVHPYQGIYFNPVVRKQMVGKFERDYWNISAAECARYLLDNTESYAIHVTGNNWVQNVIPAFSLSDRERLHIFPLRTQPYPFEYLYYNYYNDLGNEASFEFYVPVFSVEKDGIKLSEVFQRGHTGELNKGDVIEKIFSYATGSNIDTVTDGDYETYWQSSEVPADFVIQLKGDYSLYGVELFPFANYRELPEITLFSSKDGVEWIRLDSDRAGTNGLRFSVENTKWFRIQCNEPDFVIRDILLYGFS